MTSRTSVGTDDAKRTESLSGTTIGNFIAKTSVSKKLISGFAALTVISMGVGLAGLFFVDRINDTLEEITNVAEPTVFYAENLNSNIWEATKVAEEIIADEELEEITLLAAEFAELGAAFTQSYGKLASVATDPGLSDELETTRSAHGIFVTVAEEMFATHRLELEEEIKAKRLLNEFDELGQQIITALDEFAIENEEEMRKVQVEIAELLRGGAPFEQIEQTLLQLMQTDYPVVEAALKLQRQIIEMQDTAGEYLAEESLANLGPIAEEFENIARSVRQNAAILSELAESDEDRADAKALNELFDQWMVFAGDDEMLFDTHADMLRAETKADELTEQLEEEADRVAAVLDQVAKHAEAVSNASEARANSAVTQASLWILTLLLAALSVSGLLIYFASSSVMRPLKGMTQAMRALSGGDSSITVPSLERHDEIGEMAGAVQVFKENAIEKEELNQREQANIQAREARAKKIDGLIAEFETSSSDLLGSVNAAVSQLRSNAQSLSATAEQATSQSAAVAASSEEADANVQTVSSATEQLSSSIQEITQQMDHSSQITKSAAEEAQTTTATVNKLGEASQKIGDVVNLITDIAEQTNLLALNATIEAARAGDAGKGFAVVASEVKSLANQTAKATEEISSQIGGIQVISSEAAEAIQKIGRTIGEMSEIASTISAAIEEQRAATQEIARNVAEASSGTADVSSNVAGLSEGAQETQKSAKEVLLAAEDLRQRADSMSSSVDGFMAGIRAA